MARPTFPERAAGGYTRADGTVEFWTRVRALCAPDHVVLDFGAGRGLAGEDASGFRRSLQCLRGTVAEVVGADVDPAVLDNPLMDRSVVIEDGRIPLADASVDVIVANWTFEHIDEPNPAARELERVLRVGGWLCARTPNRFGYVAAAAALVPNTRHVTVLRAAQPGRKTFDVFPTRYRMNTRGALRRHFPPTSWSHHTYGWVGDPAYLRRAPQLGRLWWKVNTALPEALSPVWMIFLRRVR